MLIYRNAEGVQYTARESLGTPAIDRLEVMAQKAEKMLLKIINE